MMLRMIQFVSCSCILLLLGSSVFAETGTEVKKKNGKGMMITGAIMMGAGTVIGIAAVNQGFHHLGSTTGGENMAFATGITSITVGAGLLTWGLVRHHNYNKTTTSQLLSQQAMERRFLIGVYPTKGGVAGGMVLHW